jgi:hypothetical protein
LRTSYDVWRIYDKLALCDVVMSGIQAETPDLRVVALPEICRELQSGPT